MMVSSMAQNKKNCNLLIILDCQVIHKLSSNYELNESRKIKKILASNESEHRNQLEVS